MAGLTLCADKSAAEPNSQQGTASVSTVKRFSVSGFCESKTFFNKTLLFSAFFRYFNSVNCDRKCTMDGAKYKRKGKFH